MTTCTLWHAITGGGMSLQQIGCQLQGARYKHIPHHCTDDGQPL